MPWWGVRYLDRLFVEATVCYLPGLMVRLHVVNVSRVPTLRPWAPPSRLVLKRTPKIYLQGIFLVCKLFGKIPGIAPKRKFGAGGIRRATTTLFLVGFVKESGEMFVSCSWEGR